MQAVRRHCDGELYVTRGAGRGSARVERLGLRRVTKVAPGRGDVDASNQVISLGYYRCGKTVLEMVTDTAWHKSRSLLHAHVPSMLAVMEGEWCMDVFDVACVTLGGAGMTRWRRDDGGVAKDKVLWSRARDEDLVTSWWEDWCGYMGHPPAARQCVVACKQHKEGLTPVTVTVHSDVWQHVRQVHHEPHWHGMPVMLSGEVG